VSTDHARHHVARMLRLYSTRDQGGSPSSSQTAQLERFLRYLGDHGRCCRLRQGGWVRVAETPSGGGRSDPKRDADFSPVRTSQPLRGQLSRVVDRSPVGIRKDLIRCSRRLYNPRIRVLARADVIAQGTTQPARSPRPSPQSRLYSAKTHSGRR
jgi:hypothetical protein